MPIAAEHAFKEKSAKLLILLPLRTISKRTFQCETPCKYHIILSHRPLLTIQKFKRMVGQNTLIDTLPLILLNIDNMIMIGEF